MITYSNEVSMLKRLKLELLVNNISMHLAEMLVIMDSLVIL